jgi:hypothetical protein
MGIGSGERCTKWDAGAGASDEEASERADMGGECYDGSLAAWQFVQLSSTAAALNRVAILIEA